jgi:hypothetical protein
VTVFTRSREPEASQRPRSEVIAGIATTLTRSSRPEGIVLQAIPRSGQTEDAVADEVDAAVRPRVEVDAIAAAASSSRLEGIVLQAMPRACQTGRARADDTDAAVRPRAEVDAIAAAASSSRLEGIVLQAMPRSCQTGRARADVWLSKD